MQQLEILDILMSYSRDRLMRHLCSHSSLVLLKIIAVSLTRLSFVEELELLLVTS